jgi:macrolide transport system ATP-binding/permease protein
MAEPLISLRGITRSFVAGDQTTTVLADVDLDIFPGEMVAIVGASGSGKSTLMNVIGCLDRPTSGSFRFAGQDVGAMDENARARLRRAHFGFIFQRYQLLPDLDATGNVEIPAVYAGAARGERRHRARDLLAKLGLAERAGHRPSELSGGQQQRVSVARALMNGGEVILADEPTGALDSKSGADLMALLRDLNRQGHTIILVTHDPAIAASADRVVEIRDGRIVADRRNAETPAKARLDRPKEPRGGPFVLFDRLREALSMALKAMGAHRLRTFLTMLGIIIGIASVVAVVALGTGSQQKVLADISAIGTSTIDIRPGSGFGDRRANAIETLVPADATALAGQPWAVSVSPEAATNVTVVRGNISTSAQVRGVGAGYFNVGAFSVTAGSIFGQDAVDSRAQVAVLAADTAQTLFPEGSDPVGRTVIAGGVPLKIIGVVKSTGASFGPSTLRIYTPYSTVGARFTGKERLDSISVRISDEYEMSTAEGLITDFMLARHGTRDFFLTNSDTIRGTIQSTTQTLTVLVAAIAVISLVVGGIGVMNIMLVSVTERTREIGVRMAVGARRSDIVAQFLIEAILVCLIGGVLGVGLAMIAAEVATAFFPRLPFTFSPLVAALAFLASSGIGVVFGYLPARSASRLDPVVALARE